MKLIIETERLCHLDELIRKQTTGNSTVLSKRLLISRSRLKALLGELRDLGIEIRWDEAHQTYYYPNPETVTIQRPIIIRIATTNKM